MQFMVASISYSGDPIPAGNSARAAVMRMSSSFVKFEHLKIEFDFDCIFKLI